MIKIFGHQVTVNIAPIRGKSHNGLNVSDHNSIEVNSEMPFSKQEEIFLHELLHNLSDNLNLGLKEDTVARLSVALHTVIVDNPDVFRLKLPEGD